jgi:3-methyladenine DNA glycosylase AlkD
VAALVDEPSLVTSRQMDQWCRDFDNWGTCDTVCFKLFDQAPPAWEKVHAWSDKRDEFQKRAAFALLACLGVHDKKAPDERFIGFLPLIEKAAGDDRNFVKKAANWALRVIGRRNVVLNEAALAVARRLAESPESAPRWVGKDAVRELTSAVVLRQLTRSAKNK